MVPIEIGINYHHTLINCCSHCFSVSFSLFFASSYFLVFSALYGAFLTLFFSFCVLVFCLNEERWTKFTTVSIQHFFFFAFSIRFLLLFVFFFFFHTILVILVHSFDRLYAEALHLLWFFFFFWTVLSRIRNVYMCTHWNLYQSASENLYDLWQYLHKYKVTDGWLMAPAHVYIHVQKKEHTHIYIYEESYEYYVSIGNC